MTHTGPVMTPCLLLGQQSAARIGSELARKAEESGHRARLFVAGAVVLVILFGFVIKMKRDT